MTHRIRERGGIPASAILLLAGVLLPVEASAVEEVPVREVHFSVRVPGAHRVTLAGDFNGWSSGKDDLVDPEGDGTFEGSLRLPRGLHPYVPFADGRCILSGGRARHPEDLFLEDHIGDGLVQRGPFILPTVQVGEAPFERTGAPLRDWGPRGELLQATRTTVADRRGLHPGRYERVLKILETPGLAEGTRKSWVAALRQTWSRRWRASAIDLTLRQAMAGGDLEGWTKEFLQAGSTTLEQRDILTARLARMMRPGGIDDHAVLQQFRRAVFDIAGLRRLERFETVGLNRALDPDEALEVVLERILGRARSRLDTQGERTAREGLEILARAREEGLLPRDLADELKIYLMSSGPGRRLPELALRDLREAVRRWGAPPFRGGLLLQPFRPPVRNEQGVKFMQDLSVEGGGLPPDVLLWCTLQIRGLRRTPWVAHALESALDTTADSFLRRRIAIKLAYMYLARGEVSRLRGLVERVLQEDPWEQELLANVRDFIGTFRRLSSRFVGLMENPWDLGLTTWLMGLCEKHSENGYLQGWTGEELVRADLLDEARTHLDRALALSPGDGRWIGASLRLVERVLGGREALKRAWVAWGRRRGDPELDSELLRLGIAHGGDLEMLKSVLAEEAGRWPQPGKVLAGATGAALPGPGGDLWSGVLEGVLPALLKRGEWKGAAACMAALARVICIGKARARDPLPGLLSLGLPGKAPRGTRAWLQAYLAAVAVTSGRDTQLRDALTRWRALEPENPAPVFRAVRWLPSELAAPIVDAFLRRGKGPADLLRWRLRRARTRGDRALLRADLAALRARTLLTASLRTVDLARLVTELEDGRMGEVLAIVKRLGREDRSVVFWSLILVVGPLLLLWAIGILEP